MRISDWSSDVCSSDLFAKGAVLLQYGGAHHHHTVAVYDVHASVPLCRREFAQFSKAIAQGALRNAQLPRGAGAMPVHLIQHRADAIQLRRAGDIMQRSEEHTSELQSLMRISYAVFCLKKKKQQIAYRHYLNSTH